MNYLDWNKRVFPSFQEEYYQWDNATNKDVSLRPSLSSFRVANIYDIETRALLVNYFDSCQCLYVTTDPRRDAYTGEVCMSFALYTDGECFFTSLLINYIKQDDFALPQRWFELIKLRNFEVPKYKRIDSLLELDGATMERIYEESFDVESSIKKYTIF